MAHGEHHRVDEQADGVVANRAALGADQHHWHRHADAAPVRPAIGPSEPAGDGAGKAGRDACPDAGPDLAADLAVRSHKGFRAYAVVLHSMNILL